MKTELFISKHNLPKDMAESMLAIGSDMETVWDAAIEQNNLHLIANMILAGSLFTREQLITMGIRMLRLIYVNGPTVLALAGRSAVDLVDALVMHKNPADIMPVLGHFTAELGRSFYWFIPHVDNPRKKALCAVACLVEVATTDGNPADAFVGLLNLQVGTLCKAAGCKETDVLAKTIVRKQIIAIKSTGNPFKGE